MIIIIHGEDIVKSRQQLDFVKTDHKEAEILSLDGKKINLTDLKQAMETSSMFVDSKLVILENLLTLKKNPKLEEVLSYLKKNPPSVDLVFWEKEKISKTMLNFFPKAQVFLFEPEAVLFKFLDSLKPKNNSVILALLLQSLKTEPVEIIFYMLVRHLRFLILLRDGVNKGTDELDRLAPWQKGKLATQAKLFSLEQLVNLYHRLLEIDYQQKTGQNNFNLEKELELFATEV